jgi:tetratricopeptide (TPR) repeat protein
MKRLFPVIVVLLLAASFSGLARAENVKIPTGDILTAIDVATLLKNGSSAADVAKSASEQRGFDRQSALKAGKTDLQILNYLISGTVYAKDVSDKNMAIRGKFDGDKLFKESRFDKAAAHYTLAIRNARDKYDLYKARGDSYKQYLKTKGAVSTKKGAAGAAQSPDDMAMRLVCSATNSDYRNSLRLNGELIQKLDTKIKVLNGKMGSKNVANPQDTKVAPYHNRAAGNILDMREMRVLYSSRTTARQTDIDLKKSLADVKLMCGEEDPALSEWPTKKQGSK